MSLCLHYANGLTAGNMHYGSSDNSLYSAADATKHSLEEYLNCEDCAIETPTVHNRLLGGVKALAQTIFFLVQRPFACLLSLVIKSDIDPAKHPILTKIGRLLTIPKNYHQIAWREFKGYVKGGSSGKAEIIVAQNDKSRVDKMIYANHFRDIKEMFTKLSTTGSRGEVVTLDDNQNENNRLSYLRRNPIGVLKISSFQNLIDQNLISPNQKTK